MCRRYFKLSCEFTRLSISEAELREKESESERLSFFLAFFQSVPIAEENITKQIPDCR